MASNEDDRGGDDDDAAGRKDHAPADAAEPPAVRTPKRPISRLSRDETPGIRLPRSHRAARRVQFKTPISQTLGFHRATPSRIARRDGECAEPTT